MGEDGKGGKRAGERERKRGGGKRTIDREINSDSRKRGETRIGRRSGEQKWGAEVGRGKELMFSISSG